MSLFSTCHLEEELPPAACPECGGEALAIEVMSWANFYAGKPEGYDPEDLTEVKTFAGCLCICRGCQHSWEIAVSEPQEPAPDGPRGTWTVTAIGHPEGTPRDLPSSQKWTQGHRGQNRAQRRRKR